VALRFLFQTIFDVNLILGGKLSNVTFDQIAKNRIELCSGCESLLAMYSIFDPAFI